MSFVSKLHQQLAADEATLQALRNNGDQFRVTRSVSHQFTAPEEEKLGALGYLLEQMQLGEAELHQGNEGYRLEVTIPSSAEWPEIVRTSILLKCLSAAFQVEYQGWGSPVVSG